MWRDLYVIISDINTVNGGVKQLQFLNAKLYFCLKFCVQRVWDEDGTRGLCFWNHIEIQTDQIILSGHIWIFVCFEIKRSRCFILKYGLMFCLILFTRGKFSQLYSIVLHVLPLVSRKQLHPQQSCLMTSLMCYAPESGLRIHCECFNRWITLNYKNKVHFAIDYDTVK